MGTRDYKIGDKVQILDFEYLMKFTDINREIANEVSCRIGRIQDIQEDKYYIDFGLSGRWFSLKSFTIYDEQCDDATSTGKKNDRKDGKLMWELLPLTIIKEIVKVFTFGAKKYSPNSWQNLDNGYERYKAALFRHLVAFEEGESHDPESGLHHLSHMAWNAIAMLWFAINGKAGK